LTTLDKINTPKDLETLTKSQLGALCAELREFLIQNVSDTGGHLASNLGVVELTVAIHLVFDTSVDRLVFDVGHQCYAHKILTGRKNSFPSLRKFGGLSGFPKPSESEHDAFIAGHASTAVSVALGIARARTLSKDNYSVLALLWDGALTGGLVYEAMSDAAETGEPLIIILNDNGMSINGNVGGVANYLSRRRMKPSYFTFKNKTKAALERVPGGKAIYRLVRKIKTLLKGAILHDSLFEEMGLEYSGPIDGHDIPRIVEALEWGKRLGRPVVVHLTTQKGRGYKPAEQFPEKYHGVSPFDSLIGAGEDEGESFSDVFGDELKKLAESNSKVCAITASMTIGTGLSGFAKRFPDRFFDVAIAEGHAVTMAAGLGSRGFIPVVAVYSSFLQRSYDMLIHDAAISKAHMILAVDRAGLVPGDGETHQGIFDIAYLTSVPGITIFSPASFSELRDMLESAIQNVPGLSAVRFPRGGQGEYTAGGCDSSKVILNGDDITIVTYGISTNTALEAARLLKKEDITVEIVKLGRIYPIEMQDIIKSSEKTGRLLILEECVSAGSIGEKISAKLAAINKTPNKIILKNVGDSFLPCGGIEDLQKLCGIDTMSVCEAIKDGVRK
jgi:1-deoxy-D-xylulose-5-phosphate synthase